jgi:site-specific recombinase XerD
MTLRLVFLNPPPAGASPYRLVDAQNREVNWANQFLDAQRVRQLSLRSLRAYAYDLLHLARWLHPRRRSLHSITETVLLQYVSDQLESQPTPSTINHRLSVVRSVYRFHYGREIPSGKSYPQHLYTSRSPLGYGRRQPRVTLGLRVRQPRRVIVPLSVDEVARFWKSFRNFRDLAIVALMLLDGLRSCEVLQLQLEDLCLSESRLRVLGKGSKERVLPLPTDTVQVLQNYLHWERPLTNSSALFVSWKGCQRGLPMTAAGLRSLFRYHRLLTRVPQANPHRFRHTFGTDMVRAGISLPALMHLMGHAHIHTTMLYVELAPKDVWREYARAVEQRVRLSPPTKEGVL